MAKRSETGGAGGTGIALYKGSIYAEINDRIVRYALTAGSIVPQGPATTVVSGLPLGGDHPMHPFAITADGSMYVDVGTATNSCQLKNRTLKSPGADPCTELETRGGTWRYDANKTNQPFTPADRYATGIRNGEGFAVDAAGKRVFVTQHGRDQLHANWPDLYKPDQEATLPAEELLLLKQGGDYGWPECYYDAVQQKLVLAPEYGGDGGNKVGVCANKIASGGGLSCALGTQCARCSTTRSSFRPITATGCSSPSTVHGIGHPMPRRATTLSFSRCPAAGLRVRAKYLPTVLRERSRPRRKPRIVPAASLSDRMDRSTFPTISPGGSTGLFMWAALLLAGRSHSMPQRIGFRPALSSSRGQTARGHKSGCRPFRSPRSDAGDGGAG